MKQKFEDIKPVHGNKTLNLTPEAPAPKLTKPLFQRSTSTVPLANDIDVSSYQLNKPKKGWGSVITKVLAVIVFLSAVIYGLSYVFRVATVTITPKTVHSDINQTIQAVKDQNTNGAVAYQIMTVSESVNKQVVATKTDVVSTHASGTVILYNNQSETQKLVAQTRFADPKGSIFRLKNAVTIPKKFTKAGQTVPGSIEAILVADVPGTPGNIGLSDFTVMSFAGTAKSKLVYARSKTAFTGGASGSVYFLNESEFKAFADPMVVELEAKLRDQSLKQIPEGYVLLSDSLQFIPDSDKNKNPTTSEKADFTLSISGKMRGILIKQIDLAKEFIDSTIADQEVTVKEVTVRGIPQLTYDTTTVLSSSAIPNTISFKVSGTVDIVWNVDKETIRNALVNVLRKDFSARMQSYSSVEEAELGIDPFWIHILPKDPAKINIEIKDTATN